MSRNLADLQYELDLDARANASQEVAEWKAIAQREAKRADKWRSRNRTLGRLFAAVVLGGFVATTVLALALINVCKRGPAC